MESRFVFFSHCSPVSRSVTVPSPLSTKQELSQVAPLSLAFACNLSQMAAYFVTHPPSAVEYAVQSSATPNLASAFCAHCAYLPAAIARPDWHRCSGVALVWAALVLTSIIANTSRTVAPRLCAEHGGGHR